MFLSDSTKEAEATRYSAERIARELRAHDTPEEKIGHIYADFTTWGKRIEIEIVRIRRAAIWIGILMVPVAIRACQGIS